MGFSSDFIESVRAAGDIVRVIADYVPLKQAGARYKGLCPFHQEKTPSFSVDPNNQLFYCFGCQTGGDLFKFVMLYEKVGFPEAVESLANRFGIPLPKVTRTPADDERERTLEMNEAAARLFAARLTQEKRCRDYLARRGLDDETARKLGLGYAPDEWEVLRGHLLARGFKPRELLRGGLVLARKSGQGEYDRFRNRLIFPIRDLAGRIVAFGGRTLGDAEPKYINSPETPAYTKGNHLYGLDSAREAIRREGQAIVVEGYLDLAALVQAGFDNVVASLGTSFTPAQARLLARYTDRVVVSYDGDAAGAAATARSLDLLLERGFSIRVVELPAGTDPDDFIRAEGAEAYGQLLRNAPEYLEFLLHKEMRGRDLGRVDEKIAVVNAVLPHLAKLGNPIERTSWAAMLADALAIGDDLVLQELRAALATARTRIRERPRSSPTVREAEARLVAVLLRSEEERAHWAQELDESEFEGTRVAPIVRAILRRTREGKPVDAPAVMGDLTNEADRDLCTRIAFRAEPETGPSVEDCLWAFKRERLQRQGREVVRELNRLDDDGDDVDRRLMRVQELARQRDALNQT